MEVGSGDKQPLGPVVQIDEGRIQAHLDGVVRSTVEEALNALLDAEADHLCGARKYERSEGRKDTSGQLRSAAAHQGRRSDLDGTEAALVAV
jgi:putative transposase